eukprot:6479220-Amphidinium_carterae.1
MVNFESGVDVTHCAVHRPDPHPIYFPHAALLEQSADHYAQVRLDIAACAHQTHRRIGEAQVPGPPRGTLPASVPVGESTKQLYDTSRT